MIFDEIELKENVKSHIHNFCIDNNIDNLTKVNPNTWDCLLQDIGNTIFLAREKQKNNRKSLIEYNNIEQLYLVYNIYSYYSRLYNKEITIDKFSLFSHINIDTFYTWLNREVRTDIYIDNDTNEFIVNLDMYKFMHNNDMSNTTRFVSNGHSEFVKNIKKDNENSLNNININDKSNVGASMKLNTVFHYNGMYGHDNKERVSNRLEKKDINLSIEHHESNDICLPYTDKNSD